MTGQAQVSGGEVSEASLWLGLLGGPLAVLVQVAISGLLLPLLCSVEWRAVFHLVTLTTAITAFGAILLAWQGWRALRSDESDAATFHHKLAFAGLVVNSLALALILARWLPTLLAGLDCGSVL